MRIPKDMAPLAVLAPVAAIAGIAGIAAIAAVALVAAPQGARAADPPNGPVVVELFTSQGCSSCPPADRLLTRLGKDPRFAGRVLPLSFHVDYWNYIGWQDPFSSPRWSARQNDYARAFRSERVYTPQVVVNGASECVGNEEGAVVSRISAALEKAPAGQVRLTVAPQGSGPVKVAVGARVARAGAQHGLDLLVALYQTGLDTPVRAGENASRTLHNDYVVRRLEKAFTVPAAPGAERAGEVTLAVDPSWDRNALGVVAFLQDPVTLEIQGAAAQRLAAR
jgi:hypothetical protein